MWLSKEEKDSTQKSRPDLAMIRFDSSCFNSLNTEKSARTVSRSVRLVSRGRKRANGLRVVSEAVKSKEPLIWIVRFTAGDRSLQTAALSKLEKGKRKRRRRWWWWPRDCQSLQLPSPIILDTHTHCARWHTLSLSLSFILLLCTTQSSTWQSYWASYSRMPTFPWSRMNMPLKIIVMSSLPLKWSSFAGGSIVVMSLWVEHRAR